MSDGRRNGRGHTAIENVESCGLTGTNARPRDASRSCAAHVHSPGLIFSRPHLCGFEHYFSECEDCGCDDVRVDSEASGSTLEHAASGAGREELEGHLAELGNICDRKGTRKGLQNEGCELAARRKSRC